MGKGKKAKDLLEEEEKNAGLDEMQQMIDDVREWDCDFANDDRVGDFVTEYEDRISTIYMFPDRGLWRLSLQQMREDFRILKQVAEEEETEKRKKAFD